MLGFQTWAAPHDHGNGKLDHKVRQASRFVQILQRARARAAMQAKTFHAGRVFLCPKRNGPSTGEG
jgi:hypothetical protein